MEDKEGRGGQSAVIDRPESEPLDTNTDSKPEYHVDIEQAQLADFSKRYGEHLFGPESTDKEANESQARRFLNQTLTASLVFTGATRSLRQQGITESIDQVKDPMVRLQAIQAAQKRIEEASHEQLQKLYNPTWGRRLSQDEQQWVDKYRPELDDIAFGQYLVNGHGENQLRAKFDLPTFEYGLIPETQRQFLTEHLNEINIVKLAAEQDDLAAKEGRKGRVFGKSLFGGSSKSHQGEWLPRLMTMNGFVEEDSLLSPKDMDPVDKKKYADAFETYREEFGEKNTTARQELNQKELAKIAEIEGLLAEYEETAQLHGQQAEIETRSEVAQQQYNTHRDLLQGARQRLATLKVSLGEANFLNRKGRTKVVKKQQGYVDQLGLDLGRWHQELTETGTKQEKANNAVNRKKEIETKMQNKGYSSIPEVTKQRLEEQKAEPRY